MKNEIKEILEYVLSLTYGNENAIKGINKVEDYITNLQEENERLKEQNKMSDEQIEKTFEVVSEHIYESRCDNAINFIDQVLQFHLSRFDKKQIDEDINTLIGILSNRGDSNE